MYVVGGVCRCMYVRWEGKVVGAWHGMDGREESVKIMCVCISNLCVWEYKGRCMCMKVHVHACGTERGESSRHGDV